MLPSESVEETYEDSVLVNFCYTCGMEVLLSLLHANNHLCVYVCMFQDTHVHKCIHFLFFSLHYCIDNNHLSLCCPVLLLQFDFVMFPLGLLAMANHAPPLDGKEHNAEKIGTANMKLDWYFFNEKDRIVLEENIEDLLGVI